MLQTDVLIIGTGIAGATAALKLAEDPNRHITIITRELDPHESNTGYAQGGIISRGPDDSADLLVMDILEAGAAHPCQARRAFWRRRDLRCWKKF